MSKEWNEASIREEFINLDEKTGLHGAALPIRFGQSKNCLGYYCSLGFFWFSTVYFNDPDWNEEDAIDTIRHEYAHYMDHKIHGNHGHGQTWKACCLRIGAMPCENCIAETFKYHSKKTALKKRAEQFASSSIGKRIEHPGFGIGMITAVTGESTNCRVTVDFANVGQKILGFAWVDNNCRIID